LLHDLEEVKQPPMLQSELERWLSVALAHSIILDVRVGDIIV
jgi:hypothetical protein